ncbi:YoaP domain-containing protein [Methanobrevibacter sp. DSM 116169]|uniref:GNAT family N-acetyltransferase n=1 Tax=Methanobrevibacter sp. DSM 116169 TaxID=3242727 RepID=UPI0038FC074E
MANKYINLDLNNINDEHICCAITNTKHKHHEGVLNKKKWLKTQIPEGHVFRKLDDRGKVFIEYCPLEYAYVPIEGENYNYIYCFWVSGKFKKNGHGKNLLNYAIEDSKKNNKSGLCVITGKDKKLPFLSDGKYLVKHGFKVVDSTDSFNLLALSFDDNPLPKFSKKAKENKIADKKGVVIYYSDECPYINNCILEIKEVCNDENIDLKLIHLDTIEKAKDSPVILNNFVVFYNGEFITHELLNKGRFKKFLKI